MIDWLEHSIIVKHFIIDFKVGNCDVVITSFIIMMLSIIIIIMVNMIILKVKVIIISNSTILIMVIRIIQTTAIRIMEVDKRLTATVSMIMKRVEAKM